MNNGKISAAAYDMATALGRDDWTAFDATVDAWDAQLTFHEMQRALLLAYKLARYSDPDDATARAVWAARRQLRFSRHDDEPTPEPAPGDMLPPPPPATTNTRPVPDPVIVAWVRGKCGLPPTPPGHVTTWAELGDLVCSLDGGPDAPASYPEAPIVAVEPPRDGRRDSARAVVSCPNCHELHRHGARTGLRSVHCRPPYRELLAQYNIVDPDHLLGEVWA